jgi:uncharacterized membrane protein YeaQ/YmgE (transglycosylase-associated protein family)
VSAQLVIAVLIGGIAGWQADPIMQGLQYLVGQIARRTGFGLVGDIIIGIAGAFIASIVFRVIFNLLQLGAGFHLQEIFGSALGAVLMLVIMRLARGGQRAD